MIIDKINFPIYITFILLSFIIAILFISIYLKKHNIKNKDILLYISTIIPFGLLGSLAICYIINENVGLSSYAGCFSLIIASLFFEKINPSNNKDYIKSTIMSLPLIYGISKLGCHFAGCCYGLPYNGQFSVTYTDGLNIPLFPIQLLESIVFILLFIIILIVNKKFKTNIIDFTIIISALSKFTLDFLRYDHLTKIVTINQIISLLLVIFIIVKYIYKKLNKKN